MDVELWVPYMTLILAAIGATASLTALGLPYARSRREAAAARSAHVPRPNVVWNFNHLSSRRRHVKVSFSPASDGSVCRLVTAEVLHPTGMEIALKGDLATDVTRPNILVFDHAVIIGPNKPHVSVSVTIELDSQARDFILVRFKGHGVNTARPEIYVDVEIPDPVHSIV